MLSVLVFATLFPMTAGLHPEDETAPLAIETALEEVEGLIAEGEVFAALEALEAIEGSRSSASDLQRGRTHSLRARCAYELGDWSAAEKALRATLAIASLKAPVRAGALENLARVLTRQELPDEALDAARRAMALDPRPSRRASVLEALLRARRFREMLPEARAAVTARPRDVFTRLCLGLALSKTGASDEALVELDRVIAALSRRAREAEGPWRDPPRRTADSREQPSLLREARLEAALALGRLGRHRPATVHLLRLLEADPYDAEAAHQLGRQLIAAGTRATRKTAVSVEQYAAHLRRTRGRDSSDRHLANRSEGVAAELRRLENALKLQDVESVVPRLGRLLSRHPGHVGAHVFAAEFWARNGLLAEAEAVLDRLDPLTDEKLAESIVPMREQLRARRGELEASTDEETDKVVAELASVRYRDAGPLLEKLLNTPPASAEETSRSAQTARLILCLEPQHAGALEHLAERTRQPALLILHLHYLARIDALDAEGASGHSALREKIHAAAFDLEH